MAATSTVFHDVVSLVHAVAWPLAALGLLLVLRPYLPELVEGLGRRVSRISWASISVEFAVASEVGPEIWRSLAYLRDPTGTQRVPDSGQALFALIKAGEKADSATIDLGTGDQWLTSRLYIFALVLSEIIGVRCLAFVETRDGVVRRFTGLASPHGVCTALERNFPWFGGAVVSAQLNFATPDGKPIPEFEELKNVLIEKRDTIDELTPWQLAPLRPLIGAAFRPADLTDAQAAEAIATSYLIGPLLHRTVAVTATEENGWVRLGTIPAPEGEPPRVREERARWITGGVDLDSLLGDALMHPSVVEASGTALKDLQRDAIRQHNSDFVAVVDSVGRLRRILNRQAIADRLAHEVASLEH